MTTNLLPRFVSLLTLAILVSVVAPRSAAQHWSAAPQASTTDVPVVQSAPLRLGGLTFYSSQAEFESASEGLTLEDFAGANVDGTTPTCVTDSPLDSSSGDSGGCFDPGDIVEGLTITGVGPNADGSSVFTVLNTNLLGIYPNASPAVAGSSEVDSLSVSASGDPTAIGLALFTSGFPAGLISVEVFDGDSNLIGSTTVSESEGSVAFIGITTDTPIGSVLLGSGDGFVAVALDDVYFGSASDSGTITIAEARSLGVGETVTVQGVVSRAKGDFAYFQDETAGLTIRQTSGTFNEEVADGTISGGTSLLITGTLSEFSGLLQINEDDLASYEILSDGDIPEAQMIDVQDIVDNGEDYESELVRITGLTIDAMGTFAPGTDYQVMDDTAADTLRVPNEGDSDVDGTEIPEAEFAFEGVVTQFNSFGDNPTGGYQLLAIEESDIEVSPPTGPASEIIDNGTIVTELFNNGNIGGDCSGTHVGFFYMGVGGAGDILCAASFLIGLDETETIGQNYVGVGAETGWEPGTLVDADDFPYPDLDQGYTATFSDASGLGLDVVLNAYFSSAAEYDDFIVLEYQVTNTSNEAFTNLAPGIFMDWDVDPFATNEATILENQDLMYVFGDGTGITSYFGTAVLNGELEGWTCFVDYPVGGQHDPAQIWSALTTPGPSSCAPQDVRGPIGAGSIDLGAGESATVTFALVAGENEAGILENTIAAKLAVGEPVSSEETTQAGIFELHSAYPNPFAATTEIGFSIPEADYVRLTVYDVLGRRVATLVDGVRQAGEQTVRFDASNLGSGTYIYRLEAGGTQLTERFTVVR